MDDLTNAANNINDGQELEGQSKLINLLNSSNLDISINLKDIDFKSKL